MKKINFKKEASILQIVILVFGIIAIGWAVGSETKVVSATVPNNCENKKGFQVGLVKMGPGECRSPEEGGFTFGSDNNGQECSLSDGTKGMIWIDHCGEGNQLRCCVKQASATEGSCGTVTDIQTQCTQGTPKGECQEVSGTQYFTKDSSCTAADGSIKSIKVLGSVPPSCKLKNGSPGSYVYGKCTLPDLDGSLSTLVCCVPTAAEAEGDKSVIDCNKVCGTGKIPGPNANNAKTEADCGCTTAPGQSDDSATPVPSFWQTVGTAGIPLIGTLFQGGSPNEEFKCTVGDKDYTGYSQCASAAGGDATKVTACGKECKKSVKGGAYLGAQLTSAAFWAAGITALLQIVKATTDEHDGLYNALNYGLAGGIFFGKLSTGIIGGIGGKGVSDGVLAAADIGGTLFAGALIFLLTYKEEATQKKSFENVVWQPPLGGDHCEMCNQQGALPCSEYQCRSLGMACQLINIGTVEEKCFWMNRNDVNPPEMRPWDDALPADKKYSYIEATNVNPPDKGVKIAYESGGTNKNKCLPPYAPVTFGVALDEPGSCKLDYQQKGDFENMTYYFGGDNLLRYNHTQIMTLPSPADMSNGNLTYNNGESFSMYARCKDANGNANTADFVFQFCIDDGPDSTAPIIVATDPLSGMPVAFNITTLPVNVYTNEKAKCKWSKHDQSYDVMNNTMTDEVMWGKQVELNGITLYKHVATLNGIESDKENKFYFRCIDNAKPVANKNTESYPYTLIGTIPLEIIEIGPNETIKDNTDAIKVTLTAKTFGGYKEGEATCSFKQNAEQFSKYTTMFTTGTTQHSQDLFLPEGSYNYDVRCVDLGGNADVKNTSFYVDQDSDAPLITRLYFENGYLKMNTNEKCTCVYSTTDCTYYYKDGININAVDDTTFFTEWTTENNLYIKCKDVYGNEPYPPTSCTVVARPYDVYIPVEEEE